MAALRVHQTLGRVIPKSEQTNLRVYQVRVTTIERPRLRVHSVTTRSTLYRTMIRKGGIWIGLQTYVRKGNVWK